MRNDFNVGLVNYRLNEGFATYLSYIGMKRAEPEWDTESVRLGRLATNFVLKLNGTPFADVLNR